MTIQDHLYLKFLQAGHMSKKSNTKGTRRGMQRHFDKGYICKSNIYFIIVKA